MAEKKIFISYKSEELEIAKWVKSVLESNGFGCWMAPESITGGSSYATEIPAAIRSCDYFVLILSSKSQDSCWVSRELDLAINESKTVLPYTIENFVLKDDFAFYLANIQRYEAFDGKRVAAMERMIKDMRGLAEGRTKAAPDMPRAKETKVVVKKPKTDVVSVFSVIFGLLAMVGFLGMLFVPNIIAIILSVWGANRIRKKHLSGMGFAVSGQVLGQLSMIFGLSLWFSCVGTVIGIILGILPLVLFIKFSKAK